MSEKTSQKSTALWGIRGVFILIFVLIGAAFGTAMGHFHPNKGVIETQLEAPKVADLNNYFSLFSMYRLVNEDSKMSDEAVAEFVYQAFLKKLSSADELAAYLQGQPIVQTLSQVSGKSVEQEARFIGQGLQIQTENQLSTVRFNNLTADPKMSENLLNGFIQAADQKAKADLYADLVGKWKNLFQQVKNAADNNLGEIWKSKLQMMLSVQPLDNKLQTYRSLKAVSLQQPALSNMWLWGMIGAGIALVIGFLLSLCFIRRW